MSDGGIGGGRYRHRRPPSSVLRPLSVAMNHPAAAARRSKKPPPPQRESPGRAAKTNAAANITEMCSVRGHLMPRPPRDFTPTPLAPRKSAAAVDDSIAVAAGEDSSRHGGEVAVATRAWEGLDIS